MASSVSGIVVLTRHGDRQGFYQSPLTYTASQTNLTVLGFRQQLFNGQDLRNRYVASTADESTRVQGLDPDVAENVQLSVLADAGGEGTVITESAMAFLQGLYPAYNETLALANGTVVSWANRAQLIPVETVEDDQSVLMEPWTDCNAWQQRLSDWYSSDEFKAAAAQAEPFYDSIQNILGNRPRQLENAWNIYDFLNVEHVHDAALSPLITDDVLNQAGTWANYHESGSFSDAKIDSVGNVAGQGILSLVLDGIHTVSNASQPLKVNVLAVAYKPFLSLFKMLSIPQLENNLVDYAATMVFEVHDDKTLTVLFRNGSTGSFEPYPVLNSSGSSISIADFEATLQPHTINSLAEWCDRCSTTDARGCSTLYRLNGTGSKADHAPITTTYGRHAVSPVVAGVIGAMVTLAVAAACIGIWAFLTGSAIGVFSKRGRRSDAAGASRRKRAALGDDTSLASAYSLQHSVGEKVAEAAPP